MTLCSGAFAFDPLFLLTEVEGDCSIIRAGSGAPVPAQENRAYPYGSRLLTGMDGRAVIQFGEGCECTIEPNSRATMVQDDQSEDWKQVKLEMGKAKLDVIEDFNQNGSNKLTIETVGAICEPTDGGEYVVNVTADSDLTRAVFHTLKGEMKIYDNHLFAIPALKNDNRAEIAASSDKSFIRYRNIRGKQLIDLNNLTSDDGGPKIIEAHANSMLKMWRDRSKVADAWVVSVLVIASDGSLSEAIHYNTAEQNDAWN